MVIVCWILDANRSDKGRNIKQIGIILVLLVVYTLLVTKYLAHFRITK